MNGERPVVPVHVASPELAFDVGLESSLTWRPGASVSRVPEPGGVGQCVLVSFGDGFGYRIVIPALCLILYKLSVTVQPSK